MDYPLDFLSDRLCTRESVRFYLRRRDELSGSGDGRVWSTQLARPLWAAEIELGSRSRAEARAITARLDALDGARRAFLWADPFYAGPQEGDPGADVTLAGISSDRTAITLSGLPPGFVIRAGDRLSVGFGAGSIWLGASTVDALANGAGLLTGLGVYPYLSLGVAAGAAVEMRKPCLRMIVEPDGFTPFSMGPTRFGSGASLRLLQRV